jgi:hypothetical protein
MIKLSLFILKNISKLQPVMQMKGIARLLLLTPVCCFAISFAHAQAISHATDTGNTVHQIIERPKPKPPKPIAHEVSLGVRLNSNGWSIYSDIGKVKSKDKKHSDMFHNVRIWQIEFTEKQSPSEYKSTADNGAGTNTYKYGKINNFYALKLAYGYRSLLVGKPDPGTVSIHWVNAGGVSIGLLKPYYINVYSDPTAIKYTSATASDFLDQDLIEGSAGFSRGLDEIKFIPGVHFKSALHFDFSGNRKNVIAIETGLNMEYYSQAVQIMANQSGTSYFFDIFIAAQFGRRW